MKEYLPKIEIDAVTYQSFISVLFLITLILVLIVHWKK